MYVTWMLDIRSTCKCHICEEVCTERTWMTCMSHVCRPAVDMYVPHVCRSMCQTYMDRMYVTCMETYVRHVCVTYVIVYAESMWIAYMSHVCWFRTSETHPTSHEGTHTVYKYVSYMSRRLHQRYVDHLYVTCMWTCMRHLCDTYVGKVAPNVCGPHLCIHTCNRYVSPMWTSVWQTYVDRMYVTCM